jgi:hypothetical protein
MDLTLSKKEIWGRPEAQFWIYSPKFEVPSGFKVQCSVGSWALKARDTLGVSTYILLYTLTLAEMTRAEVCTGRRGRLRKEPQEAEKGQPESDKMKKGVSGSKQKTLFL